MRYLFLDDEREPQDVTWVRLPAAQWVIVRTEQEFQQYILENGIPDHISFDNDLGLGCNGSGIDCVKWLIEQILDTQVTYRDFTWTVHSKNPPAAKWIDGTLTNFVNFVEASIEGL